MTNHTQYVLWIKRYISDNILSLFIFSYCNYKYEYYIQINKNVFVQCGMEKTKQKTSEVSVCC